MVPPPGPSARCCGRRRYWTPMSTSAPSRPGDTGEGCGTSRGLGSLLCGLGPFPPLSEPQCLRLLGGPSPPGGEGGPTTGAVCKTAARLWSPGALGHFCGPRLSPRQGGLGPLSGVGGAL